MSNPEIIVVGSCNVDLTNYVSRFPLPGETISGESFKLSFGGKGANQAMMARLLGGKVTMLGKVGKDFFGQSYIDYFNNHGIETKFIEEVDNDVATGSASITVDGNGQNYIIIASGANKNVNKEYVSRVLPELLKSAKVLVVQMEIDKEGTLEALKLAKQANVVTIFNVAPAFNNLPSDYYKNTDILCCNETELGILSGMNVNPNDESSIRLAVSELVKFGCQHIVVTLGEKGSRLFNKQFENGLSIPIPDSKVKVIDTTGSGDAFVGTMAYYVAEKLKTNSQSENYLTQDVVAMSVKVASLTVAFEGAQSSYSKGLSTAKKSFLELS